MAEPTAFRLSADQGKSAYQRGDYLAAAGHFTAAAAAYHQAGDPLMAAEMHNNASVAYLQAGNAGNALAEVAGTPETFAAAGDLHRQAMAVGNQAAALEGLKRIEEALEAYELSADLFKQAGESDLRLHAQQARSALLLTSGRQLQAVAAMKSGLDDIQKPTPKQRLIRRLLDIPFNLWRK